MELHEVMKSFEESIGSTGLPKPPKLSELLHSEESVKEVGKPNSYPDGMAITSNTVPGWYEIGGQMLYIGNFDIPGRTINAGKLRHTIEIKEPEEKWTQCEPMRVTETPRTTIYSSNRELKSSSKRISFEEAITPSHNIIVRR